MTNALLLEDDATFDLADLDLDVRVAGISPDAAFGGIVVDEAAGPSITCGTTSPSTYGVQSRCPFCCC
jgi:hypothetical protein